MRAVNLIPLEARRGADAPSRSGGLVYGVLGVLGVLAVMVMLFSLSARTVANREAEIEQLKADQAQATTQAQQLAAYRKFSTISQARKATVSTIAAQRFDWGAALREIARVVPRNVDLVTINGTRGDPQAAAAGSAATGAAPQFLLTGCAESQGAVALLLARLRAVEGVDRVRLDTSAKADAGTTPSGAGGADCRRKDGQALFQLAIIYATAGATPATGAQSAGQQPAAQTTTTPTPQGGAS